MPGVPLQAVGLLAGSLFVLEAAILMSRPHLFDDFRYHSYVPVLFFLFGTGIILAVLNVFIVGLIDAVWVTFVGYLLLAFAALLAFYFAWIIYPQLYDEVLPDGGTEADGGAD